MYSPRRFTGSLGMALGRWSPYGDGAYYPGLAAKIHGGWVTAFVSVTPLAATDVRLTGRERVGAVSTAAPTTPYTVCAIAEATSPPNRAVETDPTAGTAAVMRVFG
jgi:hypothetical protein